MKWDFLSQPIAVASALVSRTGMMWFLLTCFAASDSKTRLSIVFSAIIQIAINMATIIQIIVQCGPNPYRAVSLGSPWKINAHASYSPTVSSTSSTCGRLCPWTTRSVVKLRPSRPPWGLYKEVGASFDGMNHLI